MSCKPGIRVYTRTAKRTGGKDKMSTDEEERWKIREKAAKKLAKLTPKKMDRKTRKLLRDLKKGK